MEAYDHLAIQYYYTGDLEKAKYYNDRMTRGKFEARFSIVRKMSENHAKKKFKPRTKGVKHIKNIENGIKKLLSDNKDKDFKRVEESILKSELIAKIIKNKMQRRKGMHSLAHLAIIANIDKDSRDLEERLK